MADLVALVVDGEPFVEAMLRVWDAGDAVLPIDPRAPSAHVEALIRHLGPAAVIGTDGERITLSGGVPVRDGDAVVVATSGTTGEPKGAVHTHAGIAEAARITAAATGAVPGSDARWLACLPLAHVGGLSVVTRALLAGVGLEVHDRADAARIDDAARRGATHVSVVHTLLRRISSDPWRLILLGADAPPRDRPPNAVATYGMTETFGGVVYDGVALEGVEVRIASTTLERGATDGEPDSGAEATGTVELRTATTMRAYRHGADGAPDPVGSDPRSTDGWLRTGDVGSIDAAGVLRVHGRSDDLIITGGSKVWPGPVEAVLRRHPAVADVAVIGEADPEWGQRVVAVVVPTAGEDLPTLDSLRGLVRSTLPVAAAPRELRVLDVLPRTPMGKIKRAALAADA